MDLGNSPAGQWLGLSALTAKGLHSIPGQGYNSHNKPKNVAKKKKGTGLARTGLLPLPSFQELEGAVCDPQQPWHHWTRVYH